MAVGQAAFPRGPSPDMPSPASNISGSVDGSTDSSSQVMDHRTPDKKHDSQQPIPPPKTDKPRPHVCQNCSRAFARLEHLKRHERSHTKEKPFECPECTRCFARRDLLLRHQQKLHFTPGQTKPRASRRESVGNMSTASGRVRKNSMASSNAAGNALGYGGHRPRANTLGHLDLASLNLFDRASLLGINEQHASVGSHAGVDGHHGGMSNHRDHHSSMRSLPKLETHDLKSEMPMPLRTAPPYVPGEHFSPDQLFPPNNGNTVDPAQLHFDISAESPLSPFQQFPPMEDQGLLDVQVSENDLAWMKAWTDSQMHVSPGAEFAIDESTPPSMPETTHVSTDNYMIPTGPIHTPNWNTTDFSTFSAPSGLMTPSAFHMDSLGNGLPMLDHSMASLSPQTSYDTPSHDGFFNTNFQDTKNNNMLGMPDHPKRYKSYDRDAYEVYYNRFGKCMAT